MRLDKIPFLCRFRRLDSNGIPHGPVYLKVHVPASGTTHVMCRDEEGNTKHLPNETDVEILDKLSNF